MTTLEHNLKSPTHLSTDLMSSVSALMLRINGEILEGRSIEWLLDFVFDSLSFDVPYDRIGIAVVEGPDNDKTLRLRWLRSRAPVRHLDVGFTAKIKGSSLEGIVQNRRPRIIEDLEKYQTSHPNSDSTRLALLDGVRSSLTYPLVSQGKTVGIVFFSSFRKDTYNQSHIDLLQIVAQELALIVGQNYSDPRRYEDGAETKAFNKLIHDLRSPLCVIEGFSEAAATEAWYESLVPEVKSFLSVIRRNSKFMLQLVNDLMEFSDVKRTESSANPSEPMPVREFLKEVENNGRTILELKEILLKVIAEEGLPELAFFDPIKIRRVFENLFSNAAKYSNRKTTVTLRVRSKQNYLIFEIEDQGIGIPSLEIKNLFQEFGRTSAKPTEGESSTGLGLAIAAEIVRQHGGEINVSSEPGKGSIFSFSIKTDK